MRYRHLHNSNNLSGNGGNIKNLKHLVFIAIIICSIVTAYTLVSCDKVGVVTPPDITETETDDFTIYYNNRGDITKRTYDEGATINLLLPANRFGYLFKGWAMDDGSLIIGSTLSNVANAKSMTLTAVWSPIKYSINYVFNGGEKVNNPTSFTIETPTIYLALPTRKGYKFLGWYAKEDFTTTKISTIDTGTARDITLYAKWSILTYTLSYDLLCPPNDDVTCDTRINSFDVNTLDFSLPIPTRARHRFLGWYDNELCQGNPIYDFKPNSFAKSVTLFAKWGEPIYDITYDLLGGSGDTNFVRHYSTSSATNVILSNQTPVKVGYVFTGWYNNRHCLGAKMTIIDRYDTNDYLLFAGWTDERATDNIIYTPVCVAHDASSLDPHEHERCYYRASGVKDKTSSSYVVGNMYNSLPVKQVDDNAFASLNNTFITLHDGIERIGANVFKNIQSTTVDINGENVSVGAQAFNGAHYSTINFFNKTLIISEEIFASSDSCIISLPNGLKNIPKKAFFNAYIPKLTLPESVTSLGENAFASLPKKQGYKGATITLGGNIEYWNSQLFIDSYIDTLIVRPTQSSIPFNVFKELKYPNNATEKNAYYPYVALSYNQAQGLTQTIYGMITGFSNPRYSVNFDCSTVNSSSNTQGHYELGEEKVCIHMPSMLASSYLLNTPIIATIIHETRHYFQHLCKVGSINGIKSKDIPSQLQPSPYQLQQWSKPYITYEPSKGNFEEYYHQPVEEDARAAATQHIGYTQPHDQCSQVLPPSIYDSVA